MGNMHERNIRFAKARMERKKLILTRRRAQKEMEVIADLYGEDIKERLIDNPDPDMPGWAIILMVAGAIAITAAIIFGIFQ